jgi:predicted outer membrane repeat protein
VLAVAQAQGASANVSCAVSNVRTGVGYPTLQAAVDASEAGDTLVVSGICVGSTTITKNLVVTGGQLSGGGTQTPVIVDGATVRLDSLKIIDGRGVTGGGLVVQNGAVVNLFASRVTGNSAVNGGGIAVTASTLNLGLSAVDSNVASLSGGGIFAQNGTDLNINESDVLGNQSGADGGGIFAFNGGGGSVTVQNFSRVDGNAAGGDGGGISTIFGTLLVGEALTGFSDRPTLLLSNTAGGSGGGIAAHFTAVDLAFATISLNRAARTGGAIANIPLPGTGTVGTITLGVTQLCGNSPDDWPGCGGGHFVPDADFEQDPSADYQSVHERGGNAGFAWDDTQGHSGTHSLEIQARDDSTSLSRWITHVGAIPVLPNHGYEVSGWLKAAGVDHGHVSIDVTFFDASGHYIPDSSSSSSEFDVVPLGGTFDWRLEAVVGLAPPDAASMRIEFRLYGEGTAWIDDLSVRDHN